MASLGSIFVDLIARTAGYDSNLKKSSKATSDFEKGVKSLLKQIAPLISGAGFAAIANSALSAAEKVNDAAESVGLTAEEYQKYSVGANLAGLNSEKFTTAITKLNAAIADGSLNYRGTNEAIQDLAERMANAKDGIERARIASEAFGTKLGASLIPYLSKGRDGILALGERAKELGIIFSNDLIKKADDFKDQLDLLGLALTRNFQSGFLSAFVEDSDKIRDIYSDPAFLQSVKDLGTAFGQIAKWALELAKIPSYLKAIFVELPSLAGQGIGNALAGRGLSANNPNVSFQRPATVDFASFIGKEQFGPNLPKAPSQSEISSLQKRSDLLKDIFKSLNDQAAVLKIQNDLFGEQDSLIERQTQYQKILSDLKEKGISLSEQELESLNKKLDAIENEKSLNEELRAADEERKKAAEELQRQQEEASRILEESIQQVRGDLASGITDAVFGAKSLGDAFKDVARRIAEAVVEAQLLKAITAATGGAGGGGAGLFGGLGSLFSGLFGFDTGTDYVTHDQLAFVHRGERIVPASENRAANWQVAGGGVTMNIYTPNADSFRASDRQIARQLKSKVAMA